MNKETHRISKPYWELAGELDPWFSFVDELTEAHAAEAMDDVIIQYTEQALKDAEHTARRPVYTVRGKSISKDLAFEIIMRSTEFSGISVYLEDKTRDIGPLLRAYGIENTCYRAVLGYDMDWFPRPEMVPCGWCHPDGYIGLDGYYCVKNPDLCELLYYWVTIIQNVTTALDMVVCFTEEDERWRIDIPLSAQITWGLHIKGDVIEVLPRGKARLLYRKYDKLYGDHRQIGPLVDPRLEEHDVIDADHFWKPKDADNPYKNCMCTSVKYMLYWGEKWPKTGDFLPPLPYHVDKNSPVYYGIPDYRYRTGPISLEEMATFIHRYAKENGY